MISLDAYRSQWLGNIRGDLLAGLVVALALIPEAIAFSIIAGVDPKVGLYASFSIAVIIAITVTLRWGPSDGALEAVISPTLWSTLSSHPRSRSCLPRMGRGVGTGATRTRSGWSRKAIGDIGRSQRRRGGMASAVRF